MLVVSSRRKAAAALSQSKVEDTQLEFSESMRRTQEAVARGGCLSRWCCRGESQDKYAVDVLATEIDSLKRAVAEVSTSYNALFLHTFMAPVSTNATSTQRQSIAMHDGASCH